MGRERPELGYYVEQFRDMRFRNNRDKARDLDQALFETMGLGVIWIEEYDEISGLMDTILA